MDSFNDFLNKNQTASNKNQKFVDSSPTSSVFARLGYDFTPSNPVILLLSPAALKHLNSMPKFLQDWQAEDMRNGVVNNNNYFKNPLQNITITIINNLIKIKYIHTFVNCNEACDSIPFFKRIYCICDAHFCNVIGN